MKYSSIVERSYKFIEEADLRIADFKLTVFASICPYSIDINKRYCVNLILTILVCFKISQIEKENKIIKKKGNTFRYLIQGYLNANRIIDADLIFDCEDLMDYPEYFNSYSEIEVDRIAAEFL